MGDFIRLLRPKQWVKNVFVLLPAFFGGAIQMDNLQILLFGFIVFCLVASSIYIINDWRDITEDRLHPIKRNRPLASGAISIKLALSAAAILLVGACSISYFLLPIEFLLVVMLYFFINLLYSGGLKKISIIDLFIVSAGFVLRVVAGAEIVDVELSFWLMLMTFLFSMFIVVGKRRDDFRDGPENAFQLRSVNKHYNKFFLDNTVVLLSSLLIVCYIMYTYFSDYFESSIYLALLSTVLVTMGLLRYLQALFVEDRGGSPTEFAFRDRFTQVVVLLWLMVFAFLIYFD